MAKGDCDKCHPCGLCNIRNKYASFMVSIVCTVWGCIWCVWCLSILGWAFRHSRHEIGYIAAVLMASFLGTAFAGGFLFCSILLMLASQRDSIKLVKIWLWMIPTVIIGYLIVGIIILIWCLLEAYEEHGFYSAYWFGLIIIIWIWYPCWIVYSYYCELGGKDLFRKFRCRKNEDRAQPEPERAKEHEEVELEEQNVAPSNHAMA